MNRILSIAILLALFGSEARADGADDLYGRCMGKIASSYLFPRAAAGLPISRSTVALAVLAAEGECAKEREAWLITHKPSQRDQADADVHKMFIDLLSAKLGVE